MTKRGGLGIYSNARSSQGGRHFKRENTAGPRGGRSYPGQEKKAIGIKDPALARPHRGWGGGKLFSIIGGKKEGLVTTLVPKKTRCVNSQENVLAEKDTGREKKRRASVDAPKEKQGKKKETRWKGQTGEIKKGLQAVIALSGSNDQGRPDGGEHPYYPRGPKQDDG